MELTESKYRLPFFSEWEVGAAEYLDVCVQCLVLWICNIFPHVRQFVNKNQVLSNPDRSDLPYETDCLCKYFECSLEGRKVIGKLKFNVSY